MLRKSCCCCRDGLGAIFQALPRCLGKATSTTAVWSRQPVSWYSSTDHPPTTSFSSPRRHIPLQPSRPYTSGRGDDDDHPPRPKHSSSSSDLYSVLGVSPKATQQQIKDQFYRLSMLYHPDRNRGSHSAHRRFTEITEAYSVLGQHELRRKYDKGLLQDKSPPHKDHHHQHHHHQHHHHQHGSTTATQGPKKIYDFDEFYRAHYGEALKWQREQAASRREDAEKAKRLEKLSDPMQRLLIISVVGSVFMVGWLHAKYKEQQERGGKWA